MALDGGILVVSLCLLGGFAIFDRAGSMAAIVSAVRSGALS